MTYSAACYSPKISASVNMSLSTTPQQDPCSASYIRSSTLSVPQPSTPANAARQVSTSKGSKLRSRARNMLIRIKKLFGLRTSSRSSARKSARKSKSSFVMPSEHATLRPTVSRNSSVRSRRSAFGRRTAQMSPTRAANSKASSSQPSIVLSSPSQKRYTIHEYAVPGGQVPSVPLVSAVAGAKPKKTKSLRLSHPAVTHIIPTPPSPLTPATPEVPRDSEDSWSTVDSEDLYDSPRPVTPASSPTASEFRGQVNPKQLFTVSFQGRQIEGSKADFNKLKATLDGLRLSDDSLPSMRSLSGKAKSSNLPYVSQSPSLSLETVGGAEEEAKTEERRASALAALEGLYPAVVQADAIITSIARDHPFSLQAGQTQAPTRPAMLQRHTVAGPLKFQPYTADLNPWGDASHPAKHGKSSAGNGSASTDSDSQRPSTPSDFADSHTHKAHYNRIESGIFDDLVDMIMPAKPAAPEPPARFSFEMEATVGADRHSTGSSTLHYHPSPAKPVIVIREHKGIQRKPVLTAEPVARSWPTTSSNKALPIVPKTDDPKRYTNGLVAERLTMNDNGYPIIVRTSVLVTTEPMSVSKTQRAVKPESPKAPKAVKKEHASKPADSKSEKVRKQQQELEKKLQCVML